MFAKISTIAALAALANGHVYMANPKPFASQMISNGPLDPSGSNFPCKSTGGASTYSANGVSNSWPLGSKQTLKTEGVAVHGGGSCQLSITYDTAPTKDTTWKVIHSIEGGCPSRDTPGNLVGNSATALNPDTYDFTLPDNIPAGDVTFAWTWLNRIGNREFYMNCAPVTLTGSGGSQSNFDSLPDMVVLNTNGITDATEEGVDYQYADPGDSVENNLNKWGWGSQVVSNPGQSGSGSGSGDSGSSAPAPTAQPDPTTTAPGGVFITQTPSATPTVAPEPEPSSSDPPAPTPSSGAPSGGSGGSGSTSAGSPCSNEGEWNCIDGSTYQQCASGIWSPVMNMAAGTQCTAGSSQMTVAAINKNKRRNSRRTTRRVGRAIVA